MDDHLVILDCDAGTDDVWALLMLIKAEAVFNLFQILAITTVAGNTNVGNVTQNVYRILDSVNRTDIPIYKGCPEAFTAWNYDQYWYGLDGFGDVLPNLPADTDYIKEGHAVNMMYELASKHPKKISFLMIGPLTNLATCIIMYKDFLDKVKDIWILGGNLYDTPRSSNFPEFNFRTDAVAVRIVLEHASKVPVYIVPVEPTVEVNHGMSLKLRFDCLGSVDSPPINLLNIVEKAIFIPKNKWTVNDAFLASAFVFREKVIVKRRKYHGKVEVCGEMAGLMLLDPAGEKNVCVIEEFNVNNIRKILAWTAGVPEAQGLILN